MSIEKGSVGLVISLLLVSLSASGQQFVGRIVGVARDPSGAVVPHVEVVAKHVATARELTTETNSAGAYTFPTLAVGEYELTASVAGFQSVSRTGVRVVAGITQTVDFDLVVGAVTQTVEVTGGLSKVDTVSTTLGTTRVTEEITRLPLAMLGGLGGARFANAFLISLAGANYDPASTGQDVASYSSIDGAPLMGRSGAFRFEIDGVNAGQQGNALDQAGGPLPESIEEFRLSFNPNAEQGWNSGVTMSLVTKSGTNKLHGSVFEYLRNDALDSRNWFAKNVSINKQNEFGFAVGGPVFLPKVYDGRDKTFFFVTYDGYRYRPVTGGVTVTVPTQKMQSGDFSEWLGPQVGTDALGRPVYQGAVYDPATTRQLPDGTFIRDPFQGNIIPANKLSSISTFLQKGYYLPNKSGIANNWTGSLVPFPTNQDRLTLKFDQKLTANQQVSVGYDNSWIYNVGGSGYFQPSIGFIYINSVQQPRVRINYTWIVRPNVLFNFRAGFNRRAQYITNPANSTFGADAGLKGVLSPGTPNVGIADVTGYGPIFDHLDSFYNNVPADISVAWTKGKHNFKFGSSFFNKQAIQVTQIYTTGNFSFGRLETGLPGFPATGVGYASYLLGVVSSASLTSPTANGFTSTTWGFYVQDQWRVTPKLTLNYGLRYDLFVPEHESYNRVGSFDPTISNPAAGGRLGALTFYGTGSGRNGLTGAIQDTYTKAFGPRFGLTYALNSKTAFRAGYGITYNPTYLTWELGAPNYGWGFTVSRTTLDNGITPAFNWNNGFPSIIPVIPQANPSLLNGSGVTYLNRADSKPARGQNINVGLERELPGGLTVRADYIANLWHGLPMGLDMNFLNLSYMSLGNLLTQPFNSPAAVAAGITSPYPGFSGSVTQALRPYPQYTGVSEGNAPAGFSTYNSFQLTVQKRMGHGLSFLGTYTASKMLGNTSYPHPTLRNLGKGLYMWDRPRMLSLSYVYELPFGPGKPFANSSNPFVKHVIGGWAFSGIHSYMSGRPLGVGSAQSIPGFGGGWVNLVPGVPQTVTSCGSLDPNDPARNRYLNINAFTTPPAFTFGNTSLLPSTRLCGYLNENLSLQKQFPIKESVKVEFGVDFFNAFNRHDWTGMSSNIGSPASFGRVSGATPPRIIQFHLKVPF